jgi:hypothetical protein
MDVHYGDTLHFVMLRMRTFVCIIVLTRGIEPFRNRKICGHSDGVLIRIFVPKRDAVTGERGRLHNEDLCGLYNSQNMIQLIKSRTMR